MPPEALVNEKGQARVYDPGQEKYGWVPRANLDKAIELGMRPVAADEHAEAEFIEKHDRPIQAFSEGALRSATAGFSDPFLIKTGLATETGLAGRAEVSSFASGLGGVAGVVTPLGPAGFVGKLATRAAGRAAAKVAAKGIAKKGTETLANRALQRTIQGVAPSSAEGVIIGLQQGVTEATLGEDKPFGEDVAQIANKVLLGGLTGGAFGLAATGIGSAAKAVTSKFIKPAKSKQLDSVMGARKELLDQVRHIDDALAVNPDMVGLAQRRTALLDDIGELGKVARTEQTRAMKESIEKWASPRLAGAIRDRMAWGIGGALLGGVPGAAMAQFAVGAIKTAGQRAAKQPLEGVARAITKAAVGGGSLAAKALTSRATGRSAAHLMTTPELKSIARLLQDEVYSPESQRDIALDAGLSAGLDLEAATNIADHRGRQFAVLRENFLAQDESKIPVRRRELSRIFQSVNDPTLPFSRIATGEFDSRDKDLISKLLPEASVQIELAARRMLEIEGLSPKKERVLKHMAGGAVAVGDHQVNNVLKQVFAQDGRTRQTQANFRPVPVASRAQQLVQSA